MTVTEAKAGDAMIATVKDTVWPRIELTVESHVESNGVELRLPGYGTAAMMPGSSGPVLIEYRDGQPFVVIWGDINQEEPTHVVPLAGAAETNRREDGDG